MTRSKLFSPSLLCLFVFFASVLARDGQGQVLDNRPTAVASPSAEPTAQQKLIGLGYPVNASGLSNALIGADEDALNLFTSARVSAQVAQQALRTRTQKGDATAAQRYFELAARAPGALSWLREALARNGDRLAPDLTVADTNNGEEAIINVAARASSVDGVIELLKAGASPNGFQDIKDWGLSAPRFIVPLGPVLEDSRLDAAAQQRLIDAFVASGVVTPHIPPAATDGGVAYGPIAFDFVQLQAKRRALAGAPFVETPNLCEKFPDAACKRASQQSKVDWCDVVRKVPRVFGLFNASYRDKAVIPPFIVRYFLGANARTSYFLVEILDYYSGYGILEVDPDRRMPHLLEFTKITPDNAGECRGGDGSGFCWRRFDLTLDVVKRVYHSDYEDPIPVSASCDVANAQSKARVASITPQPNANKNPKIAECVAQITQTPLPKLKQEAARFDVLSVLTLRPRDCVLSKLKKLMADANYDSPNIDRLAQPGFIAAAAARCCGAPTTAPR